MAVYFVSAKIFTVGARFRMRFVMNVNCFHSEFLEWLGVLTVFFLLTCFEMYQFDSFKSRIESIVLSNEMEFLYGFFFN